MTGPTGVLVAGASGCLGAHVCDAFTADGYRVTGLARGNRPGSVGHRARRLDLAAPGAADDVVALLRAERIDVVVNATLGWADGRAAMERVNVEPAEALLDAARRTGARLVQLGTVHEYGPVPEGTAIDESVPTRPMNDYGHARLAVSTRVLRAVRAGDVDGVVLRLANTLGPRPSMETFLGRLAVTLAGRPTTADPHRVTLAPARRDYVDPRDAADAVVRAAVTHGADPLVNIGSGQAYDIRSLVHGLVAAAGLPPGAVVEQQGTATGTVAGADWTLVDPDRARQMLGWAPERPIGLSLRDLYRSVESATSEVA